MSTKVLAPGDVIKVALGEAGRPPAEPVSSPQHIPPGHEQEGRRPAVVVGIPEHLGTPRYPMLIMVPLTTQIGRWARRSPGLYPVLRAGIGGLSQKSAAMLDHVRGVDWTRVREYLGTLNPKEYAPIQEGLRVMCGLEEEQ